MKQLRPFLLALTAAIIFFGACKKDLGSNETPDPQGPGEPDTTVNIGMKEVIIQLPAGSSVKLPGSKVFSYGSEQAVDASGKSKVGFEEGSTTIAYVFDANKKPVLAAFITDSTNVISPATTAKVLLYLGYNIPLQPDTLSQYFINNVQALPGAQAWAKEFETLFITDPLVLSSGGFVAPLKERMAAMIGKFEPADMNAKKVSDVLVNGNDIRSGLQVADEGPSNFAVTNWYRRRTHAFLYKMSYKDMDGNDHSVKDKVDKGTKAERDMGIDPVAAVNGFLSEIGKNIEGKGLESFALASGPFPLELEDNESEAAYKIRIVGPGVPGSLENTLTTDEESTLTRLRIETFLFDCVIPVVGIITSMPDAPTAGVMPGADRMSKTDALLSLVKTMPDVYEEIKKGNYKTALSKFLENIYKDGLGAALNEVFMIALDREANGVRAFLNERIENLMAILAVTDAALGASDLIRISGDIRSSRVVEEWEIQARSSQVRLLPKESSVVSFKQQKITAEIKNMDENGDTHPFFEWKTSGKYGKLSDTKGHSGTSFESADKDVFYYSNASQASLSDGDNFEYIYVTASMGNKIIGRDTAVINVKKHKYILKPDGATLSGKESSNNELALYLERADGVKDIASNPDISYKIVWSTAGKHGKLIGKEGDFTTSIATYDDNQMWYECLDKNTKEGTEKITAKIYSKPKGAGESEYKLFDETEGKIKINNDPKKRIIKAQFQFFHGDTTSGPYTSYPSGSQYYSYSCHHSNGVTFKEDTAAVSYSLKFFVSGRPTIGAPTSHSWKAGAKSPYAPASYAHPGYANGVYAVIYSWGARNGPSPGHTNGKPRAGYAEITIHLK